LVNWLIGDMMIWLYVYLMTGIGCFMSVSLQTQSVHFEHSEKSI